MYRSAVSELTTKYMQQQIEEIKAKMDEMESHHETVKDTANELSKILKVD
jgi:hypothetical protein